MKALDGCYSILGISPSSRIRKTNSESIKDQTWFILIWLQWHILSFVLSEVRLAFKKKSYSLHPDRQVVKLPFNLILETRNRIRLNRSWFFVNCYYLKTSGKPWCIFKLCQRQWGFCGNHQRLRVPCHAIRQWGRIFGLKRGK